MFNLAAMVTLAFSSCPNDTFIFYGMVHEKVDLEGLSFQYSVDDIEALNRKAIAGEADMIKISFHAWLGLRARYSLLRGGAALGFGNGPLVIARTILDEPALNAGRVALPGRHTTAHLLFSMAFPNAQNKLFTRFSEIEEAVSSGRVEAGVIIHENRFTYADKGLVKVMDLGEFWEQQTGSPIPLGGIVAKKSLGEEVVSALDRIMSRSVRYAMDHPREVMPFVRQHAQEMSDEVMKRHIALYVNRFTLDRGEEGDQAIAALIRHAESPTLHQSRHSLSQKARSRVISPEAASSVVRDALKQGFIRPEDALFMVHDLDVIASRVAYLQSFFPSGTLHALAIKSNPLHRILEFTRELGTGVEAATVGEVTIALKTGYPPEKIVFDSPVKTRDDLAFAMRAGVYINCDNLSELRRVDKLLKEGLRGGQFGIRINPQVGLGTILESSVSGSYSKFGVPIGAGRDQLRQAFLTYPWLTGVHLHVGSQGCGLDLLVEGVQRVYAFAVEVSRFREEKGFSPIHTLDIGGGLPVHYVGNETLPGLDEYVGALTRQLEGDRGSAVQEGNGFEGERHDGVWTPFHLITEFGRWVFVPAGFTVSRVEYVKRDPGITTLMIHAGADLFVRECLSPAAWKHEYTLLDKEGRIKSGIAEVSCNLAGPLCFAGDIIAKNVLLPDPEEGDFLVIHDTGGYTFSMWSHYNSRQTPRILGLREGVFSVLKERETPEETARFWE